MNPPTTEQGAKDRTSGADHRTRCAMREPSRCPLPARRTAGLHCSGCARQGDCLVERLQVDDAVPARGYGRAWWTAMLACALAALLAAVAPPAQAGGLAPTQLGGGINQNGCAGVLQ